MRQQQHNAEIAWHQVHRGASDRHIGNVHRDSQVGGTGTLAIRASSALGRHSSLSRSGEEAGCKRRATQSVLVGVSRCPCRCAKTPKQRKLIEPTTPMVSQPWCRCELSKLRPKGTSGDLIQRATTAFAKALYRACNVRPCTGHVRRLQNAAVSRRSCTWCSPTRARWWVGATCSLSTCQRRLC